MKTPSFLILCCLALLAGLVPAAETASAASYPAKSLRMTVPYSPGGGTDIMARTVAQFMEVPLGQKVVVVNKAGASGQIGTVEVAEARPDGYSTIMLSSNDFILAPLLNKDPGFKLNDFTLIASFNDTANCVIVKKGSAFGTLGEMLAYAKANPGKLTVSTSGDAHVFLGAMIEGAAGVKLSIVSYSGAGESLNALMGGHVEAAIIDKRFVKQAEQAGCKALGVASTERYSILPDLPTFMEQGLNVTDNQRRILAVPAKTPAEAVEALTKAVLSFGESPEFTEKLNSLSEVRKIETGALLAKFVQAQNVLFTKVVEANRDRFPLK